MHSPVLTPTISPVPAPVTATSTAAQDAPTHHDTQTRIDMLTPYQACVHLGIGPAALLALVNSGALAAYQFESAVRFRCCEVEALDLPRAA